MVISGIKALLLNLGLIASLHAEPADGDNPSAGPLVTLLASLPNPLVEAGGQEVPHVQATDKRLGGVASQVPLALPLPGQTALTAALGLRTAEPVLTQRMTTPRQNPAQPQEKSASTGARGDCQAAELQFNRDGLISIHGNVQMEIRPVRSEGVVDPTASLLSQRSAEMTTSLIVPSGATLVFGGLPEVNDASHQSALLALPRLPILGYLFGTKEKTDQRRKLVLLLTPHNDSPVQAAGTLDALVAQVNMRSRENVREAQTVPMTALVSHPAAASRSSRPAEGASRPWQNPCPAPAIMSSVPSSSRMTLPPVDLMANQTALVVSRSPESPRPAAPNSPRTAPRRHVAHLGEDFLSIAKEYYGSPRFAQALWWANRETVAWPEALVAGTRIVIPPIEQVDRGLTGLRTPRAVKRDPQVQHASEDRPVERVYNGKTASHFVPNLNQQHQVLDLSPPGGGYAIHVVQQRETLRAIARDRLGDPRRFQEIANLNQDLLTDGRILAGMRLLLPNDARPDPPLSPHRISMASP